ncbi:MAG TPA: phosphatidate cytidylyltransferase [Steroidobacteraceae bacterium]|jgi:phosphatidate cytidylyltransferase|nr:phosphatidate cytidylyltransferase [Steroidobacteraceae bacterium]
MIVKRIVTALLLGGLLLAILLRAPVGWSMVLITVAILVGAWEWSAFLRAPQLPLRLGYVLFVAILLYGAWLVSATAAGLQGVLWVALAWWLLALVWILFLPGRMTRPLAWVAGVLVLVPAWVALMRLRVDWAQGAEWTLFLLFLVWAADTGAFIAGKALGRHKLAPRVSPGKTWEGAAGGIVLGGLFAWLAAGWFVQPAVSFVAVSLVVVVFSIIGDLTESMLKRYAGLKDSGQLIPGHGGIMDRMDSITAAAPVLMLGLGLLR